MVFVSSFCLEFFSAFLLEYFCIVSYFLLSAKGKPLFHEKILFYEQFCDHLVTLWLQNRLSPFPFGKIVLEWSRVKKALFSVALRKSNFDFSSILFYLHTIERQKELQRKERWRKADLSA